MRLKMWNKILENKIFSLIDKHPFNLIKELIKPGVNSKNKSMILTVTFIKQTMLNLI